MGFVFCSREPGDAEGSDRYIRQVQEYGLPLICFSSKRFMPDLRRQGIPDPAALPRGGENMTAKSCRDWELPM